MLKKTHKTKKSKRMIGRNMGTHGGGARKKRKGSGHRGGIGMSGTGKRADHKKTLILKIYGHNYFGKQGETSKETKRDIRQRINLEQIQANIKKYKNEKGEVILTKYKILGEGNVSEKLIIKAKEASKSAIEKVKKAGGEIILVGGKVKKRKIEIEHSDVQKKNAKISNKAPKFTKSKIKKK